MSQKLRLNLYLARCGLASRRKADELIASGRVMVDGKTVTHLGCRVDPDRCHITLDGQPVKPRARFRYYVLHKPKGYLVSNGDPFGRPTIYHLLPPDLRTLRYVGRLDRDTEGLLLLTDDGALAQRLAHPRHRVVRTYLVGLSTDISEAEVQPLRQGISFEGQAYLPARVRILRRGPKGSTVIVAIAEGKKREVRMMFRALGRTVVWLKRIGFGPLKLRDLPPGKWRALEPTEVDRLKRQGPF